MKRAVFLLAYLSFLLFSACKTMPPQEGTLTTHPNTNETHTEGANTVVPGDENTVVAQFDTITITKQTFKITKSEIELVVEDLNRITLAKDYARWLTYLSEEYRQNFSNQSVLDQVSKSLPTKGIKLKNLKDYFHYVFVPSRQNMRVDDISFVSPTRVYVIMEIAKGSPAAIYILEKIDGGWKLVPKNQW